MQLSTLSSSHFTRSYWGNHCYFLFLPLLKCFSSRRYLAWVEVAITGEFITMHNAANISSVTLPYALHRTRCEKLFNFYNLSWEYINLHSKPSRSIRIDPTSNIMWWCCWIQKQPSTRHAIGFPTAPFAFKNSMTHKACESHQLSHFATFFIVPRAEWSTVNGCIKYITHKKLRKTITTAIQQHKHTDTLQFVALHILHFYP